MSWHSLMGKLCRSAICVVYDTAFDTWELFPLEFEKISPLHLSPSFQPQDEIESLSGISFHCDEWALGFCLHVCKGRIPNWGDRSTWGNSI